MKAFVVVFLVLISLTSQAFTKACGGQCLHKSTSHKKQSHVTSDSKNHDCCPSEKQKTKAEQVHSCQNLCMTPPTYDVAVVKTQVETTTHLSLVGPMVSLIDTFNFKDSFHSGFIPSPLNSNHKFIKVPRYLFFQKLLIKFNS